MLAVADRQAALNTEDHKPETIAGLDEREIAMLREVGRRWARALNGRRAGLPTLPVDPGLHRLAHAPPASRGDRFPTVARHGDRRHQTRPCVGPSRARFRQLRA